MVTMAAVCGHQSRWIAPTAASSSSSSSSASEILTRAAHVRARPSLLQLPSLSGVCLTRNRRHGATRASGSDPGFVGGEVRAASAEAAATVKYVDPEAAKELVTKEGYTIVDIRDESQYKRSHIASSLHVPLFIENTDSDIGTLLRKQMHMSFAGTFYGVAFTKTNPDFVATFEKQFQKDSKILIVCQEGLRSGKAAEELERAGFQNVSYLVNGLQKVKPGIFEKEGPKELEDAGKAGLVTIQTQFSIVLGTILVLAYLFLQLFPDQAEQLFFSNK
jgi:rhodanese-related sulfurtransferase